MYTPASPCRSHPDKRRCCPSSPSPWSAPPHLRPRRAAHPPRFALAHVAAKPERILPQKTAATRSKQQCELPCAGVSLGQSRKIDENRNRSRSVDADLNQVAMRSPVQARKTVLSVLSLWLLEIDESTPPFSCRVSQSVPQPLLQNHSCLHPIISQSMTAAFHPLDAAQSLVSTLFERSPAVPQ